MRALNARRRHAALRNRCLALAAKVQVLRNRGFALSGDEDELRNKLVEMERGLQDPALSARMEELWSRLIVLRGYADSLRVEINKRGLGEEGGLGEEIETKAKKVSYPSRMSGGEGGVWCMVTDIWNRFLRTMPSRSSISRRRLSRFRRTLRTGRRSITLFRDK